MLTFILYSSSLQRDLFHGHCHDVDCLNIKFYLTTASIVDFALPPLHILPWKSAQPVNSVESMSPNSSQAIPYIPT